MKRADEYNSYLGTATWRAKRKAVWIREAGKCQRCGMRGDDVHHTSYPSHLGTELISTLRLLCRRCHEYVHGKRAVDPATVPTFDDLEQMISDL